MIEPVMLALTTSIRPARRAMRAIISSVALPKVALRSPSEGGADDDGQFFGGGSHPGGQGDDGDGGGEENDAGIPMQPFGGDGDGEEGEEEGEN